MGSPLGREIGLEQLRADPYPILAELRAHEPVSWVPVLGGWLVTRRDLCVDIMRDVESFTVDDPRFSTAQVVGPSMLSLDGPEHRRHREPFAEGLRHSRVREEFTPLVREEARRIVSALASQGVAEIRTDLAGPLAVAIVTAVLDLVDVDVRMVLDWYVAIVADVDRISAGSQPSGGGRKAVAHLQERVNASTHSGLLSKARAHLSEGEVVSNAAVMMFGGIETSEGMTTSLFWHLLSHPDQLDLVRGDRSLGSQAIEESLRLEPAAGRVDRYATRDIELGEALIRQGDLVIVSLSAANRDPATFADPDRFDLTRANARQHLAFAQGPHACIGLHLAKLETLAALDAVLDLWPDVRLGEPVEPPSGLVFRKPRTLHVLWGRA